MRILRRSAATVLLCCFPTSVPVAQTILTGTVREDSTGRPVAGVEVLVTGSIILYRASSPSIGPDLEKAVDMKDFIDVASLEAIEIYRGASEVPVEYGGAGAGCGVILLWTRRNP